MTATGYLPMVRRSVALPALAALLAALAVWQFDRPAGTNSAGAAAAHIFMSAKGQKTGDFLGDSNQKGHQADTTVLAYSYEIVSPRDAASGQATGKRQHKPISITKALGSNSPQYLNALATNETINTVVINFFKADKGGSLVNYYRVTLTDASLADISQHSISGGEVSEDYSFTFRKIQQDDLIAKKTWVDDWAAPVS
ncbi:MAG: type VI secretion system tube protein TssD [Chloroflexota bacterium]